MSKSELHPTFREKNVYSLDCIFCGSNVCRRGMKAVLLADTRTEMYSTDIPEKDAVDLVEGGILTNHCACKINQLACIACGNEIGYTVSRPCRKCLMSCNNGHFWMYFSSCVNASQRVNRAGEELLLWGDLPSVGEDVSVIFETECFR
ncbi:protein FAM72A-like [Haliotis cracherodii]|uniref:protein FAM72A-like n=1 Tax=Haliotis cracherodii TaxID=6455 RepID=UPI0039E9D9BF